MTATNLIPPQTTHGGLRLSKLRDHAGDILWRFPAWKDLEGQGFCYGIASVLMDMVEYTHGFMLYVSRDVAAIIAYKQNGWNSI